MQATVKFHDFADPIGGEASTRPKPDFVSHPKGGLEATAQSYENREKTTDYDEKKWAALLKYDDEIAAAAGRVRRLGDQWEDELARAYLILNDKSYLGRIEEKIFAEARGRAAR